MTRNRWITVAVVLLVLALAGGAGWWYMDKQNQLPVVMPAPSFTLENLEGQPVNSDSFQGKVRLVEFMFAQCPDICPMTTANMVQVQKKLKADGLFGEEVQFISITFDPQRDTPEVMKAYADGMGIDQAGWTLLRGTEEATHKVMGDFGAFVEKQPDGNFVHSTTSLFLVDGDNQVRKIYRMGEEMPTDEVYNDIVNLAD